MNDWKCASDKGWPERIWSLAASIWKKELRTIACKSASICSSYKYTSENIPDPGGSNTISISYRLSSV